MKRLNIRHAFAGEAVRLGFRGWIITASILLLATLVVLPRVTPWSETSGERAPQAFQYPPVAAAVGGVPVFNVKTYGAVGNGSTDDRTSIKAAFDAACAAGGGIVFFPAGTYEVSKQGSNAWALQISCSNIQMLGVTDGQSVLQLITGSTGTGASSATDLLEVLGVKDVIIRDMVLDGHWGNALTRVSQASNNQTLTGTYTLNVLTTTGSVVGTSAFPASGPYSLLVMSTTGQQAVSCSAKTSNTFTTCTGGSGVINRDAQVALATTNANTGGFSLNSKYDSDPNSDGLLIRGPTNLLVENVTIRNVYGDCWSNNGNNTNHDLLPLNIRANNVKCDLAARHGFNVNSAYGLDIDHAYVTNVIGSDIFSQPFQAPVRDVQIEHGYFGAGLGAQTIAVSIDGGGSNGGWAVLGATLRNWRFVDNTFLGGFSAVSVYDIVIDSNHSVVNYATTGKANFLVELGGGDITITNNWAYNKSANGGLDGGADTGVISIYNYIFGTDGAGTPLAYCPSRVQVSNNSIYGRNGHHGVMLLSPGCLIRNGTGTATTVTDTTLVDTAATWVDHQWQGTSVRIGTATAAVSDSTGCPTSVTVPGSPCTLTLTLQVSTATTSWSDFYGAFVPTPSTGTYYIHQDTGVAEIASNSINLMDDGNGAGGDGIYMTSTTNDGPGMRVKIHDNKIQDATDGIYINFGDGVVTFPLIDIEDNVGWDDQGTPTFQNLIETNDHTAVTKWIMSGNVQGENVTNALSHTQVFTGSSTTEQLTFVRGHQLSTGQGPIRFTTTNTLPAPLVINTDYYVIGVDSTHIKVATSQANALAGTNIDLTTNGSGTEKIVTRGFMPGAWLTKDPTSGPTCMGGYPTVDHGTIDLTSTNCVGQDASIGSNTSVVLTFSGTWPHKVWCSATPLSTSTPENIVPTTVTTSAVTFSCINSTTGSAANCVDFSYQCAGL